MKHLKKKNPQLDVIPVVLCGGSGSRLWPLSRVGFPKQFLDLTGRESLFQKTANRLEQLSNADIKVAQPIFVAGEEHRFIVAEQLREINIGFGQILLEPEAKNTAPALTLAALTAQVSKHV
jgi:mannose-1-phosphate guanylyltransferase / mannose-6-phosphate isomerase